MSSWCTPVYATPRKTNAPTAGTVGAKEGGNENTTDKSSIAQNLGSSGAVDILTILKHPTNLLAKTWLADGSVKAYDNAKYFIHKEVAIENIGALSALLSALERDAKACVIRGGYVGHDKAAELDPEYRRGSVRRIADLFEDVPHHWMLVEIDNFEPLCSDPVAQPMLAIEEFIGASLPDCFQGAAYHWQLSNSAGHSKNVGKLKAHVWFWLATPYTSEQLKAWATAFGLALDKSVFNVVQIHYTAAPMFEEGVVDPILVRSGFVPGLIGDNVELEIDAGLLASANAGTQGSRHQRLLEVADNDPIAQRLADCNLIKSVGKKGELFIECPLSENHTQESGATATVYYPAHTGGYANGAFVCQHAHCRDVAQSVFLSKIGVYSVEGDFDAINAARREHQKRENERIGDGSSRYPTAEVIDLKTALTRFVFMSDGSRVADIFNPHYDLAFSDWSGTFAASKESVFDKDKQEEKEVPVSRLWKASKERKTVVCRTFKAGGAQVLNDPNGRLALNTWRPFYRTTDVQDVEAAGLGLFLDHVYLLFGPKDAQRFLDWLAHIEQRPGELPHTAWLHIAKYFGLGRNWMESVLARVWAGAVAANIDLVSVLKKDGYNGRLSCKVLAVVDEIREGGRDAQWEHSEKIKSIITEETRQINPKYGRQSVEFNACRWLMFSNHLSAIPLEDGDRRIEVVYTEALPRDSAYYTRLYAVLDDDSFIAAVAKFLGERDIRAFNPGAHATNSESKKAATKASQTPMAADVEMLVDHWPSDLIMSQHLSDIMARDGVGGPLNAAHRRTLEQYGVEALGKPLKVEGRAVRVSIVRNKAQWKRAEPDDLRRELTKANPGIDSSRDYLMEFAACG